MKPNPTTTTTTQPAGHTPGLSRKRGRPTNGQKLFAWLAAREATEPGITAKLAREHIMREAGPELFRAAEYLLGSLDEAGIKPAGISEVRAILARARGEGKGVAQ